jgi:hypothetical protein
VKKDEPKGLGEISYLLLTPQRLFDYTFRMQCWNKSGVGGGGGRSRGGVMLVVSSGRSLLKEKVVS